MTRTKQSTPISPAKQRWLLARYAAMTPEAQNAIDKCYAAFLPRDADARPVPPATRTARQKGAR